MFDRWTATQWLHDKLKERKISEAAFRIGVEHIFLADDSGQHCISHGRIAAQCSGTGTKPMDKKQVARANTALARVGFMRIERAKSAGKFGRYVTDAYEILVGRDTNGDTVQWGQVDRGVPNDVSLVAPVQASVSREGVPNEVSHPTETRPEERGEDEVIEIVPGSYLDGVRRGEYGRLEEYGASA